MRNRRFRFAEARQAVGAPGVEAPIGAGEWDAGECAMGHLYRPARRGDCAEVERELAAGADVNAVGIHQFSALMLAAREGHLAVVQLLLAHGADPNLSHPNGRTPLHFAAGSGHPEVVRALLAAGAQGDAVSCRGDTPGIEAAHWGHVGVIEVLREAQVDLGTEDREGRSADAWLEIGGVPGHFERTFPGRLGRRR